MKCNTCANERYCYDGNHQLTRDCCADNGFTAYTPMTHADRIRSMTDEELAEELLNVFAAFYDVEWSKEMVLNWLKNPVEVDNGN